MGRCQSKIVRVVVDLDDELTHVYIFAEAIGDCPLGVQGWHYKAFPKNVSIGEIFTKRARGVADYLLWPLHAPEGKVT
jgi:hypothetical protein